MSEHTYKQHQDHQNTRRNTEASNKVFIGGLPKKTTRKALKKFLSKHAKITSLYLKLKYEGGDCLGYGWVTTTSEGYRLLTALKTLRFKKRKITLTPFLQGENLNKHLESKNSKRIFVTQIPPNFTLDDFKGLFEEIAAIDTAYFRNVPGSTERVGVVFFYNARDGQKALDLVNENPNEFYGMKVCYKYITPDAVESSKLSPSPVLRSSEESEEGFEGSRYGRWGYGPDKREPSGYPISYGYRPPQRGFEGWHEPGWESFDNFEEMAAEEIERHHPRVHQRSFEELPKRPWFQLSADHFLLEDRAIMADHLRQGYLQQSPAQEFDLQRAEEYYHKQKPGPSKFKSEGVWYYFEDKKPTKTAYRHHRNVETNHRSNNLGFNLTSSESQSKSSSSRQSSNRSYRRRGSGYQGPEGTSAYFSSTKFSSIHEVKSSEESSGSPSSKVSSKNKKTTSIGEWPGFSLGNTNNPSHSQLPDFRQYSHHHLHKPTKSRARMALVYKKGNLKAKIVTKKKLREGAFHAIYNSPYPELSSVPPQDHHYGPEIQPQGYSQANHRHILNDLEPNREGHKQHPEHHESHYESRERATRAQFNNTGQNHHLGQSYITKIKDREEDQRSHRPRQSPYF